MSIWVSIGNVLVVALLLIFWLSKPNRVLDGPVRVSWFTFVAILFTSGLDVGLIMFPLTEFPLYSDTQQNPEYGFANPLSIAFGFWAFLVWGIYFVTCFYFAVIEPKVRFFERPEVKILNNLIVLATCAFTGFLLLSNLPWYLPDIAALPGHNKVFFGIVSLVVLSAVLSSSRWYFLKILSLSSVGLFFGLIGLLFVIGHQNDHGIFTLWLGHIMSVSDYFANLPKFVLPINAYHEFYLYWWFAWSIMIGQFTARFVKGMSANSLLGAMLVFPSATILCWFALLYSYFTLDIETTGFVNIAMVVVGVVFVINSLDSLIRLYADNLNLSVERFGLSRYVILHFTLLIALVAVFSIDFLQIQWVGAVVIGLFIIGIAASVRHWMGQQRVAKGADAP